MDIKQAIEQQKKDITTEVEARLDKIDTLEHDRSLLSNALESVENTLQQANDLKQQYHEKQLTIDVLQESIDALNMLVDHNNQVIRLKNLLDNNQHVITTENTHLLQQKNEITQQLSEFETEHPTTYDHADLKHLLDVKEKELDHCLKKISDLAKIESQHYAVVKVFLAFLRLLGITSNPLASKTLAVEIDTISSDMTFITDKLNQSQWHESHLAKNQNHTGSIEYPKSELQQIKHCLQIKEDSEQKIKIFQKKLDDTVASARALEQTISNPKQSHAETLLTQQKLLTRMAALDEKIAQETDLVVQLHHPKRTIIINKFYETLLTAQNSFNKFQARKPSSPKQAFFTQSEDPSTTNFVVLSMLVAGIQTMLKAIENNHQEQDTLQSIAALLITFQLTHSNQHSALSNQEKNQQQTALIDAVEEKIQQLPKDNPLRCAMPFLKTLIQYDIPATPAPTTKKMSR